MEPLVSCLCPTYGRHRVLQEAMTCFLDQDYPSKELIILNQHPSLVSCPYKEVRVYNEPQHQTLGECYARLLELAEGKWVRPWEDDDLYLPWDLSQGAEHIGEAPAWKPIFSWMSEGNYKYSLVSNCLEASMMIRTDTARKYGFALNSEHTFGPLLEGLRVEGGCAEKDVRWRASYVFRWATEGWHFSGGFYTKSFRDLIREWREHNQDGSDGRPLLMAGVKGYWRALAECARRFFEPEEIEKLKETLHV